MTGNNQESREKEDERRQGARVKLKGRLLRKQSARQAKKRRAKKA